MAGEPTVIAACYDFYLICDGKDPFNADGEPRVKCDNTGYGERYAPAPAEFRVTSFHTFADAAKYAKRHGWKVDRKNDRAQCPKCAPKKERKRAAESRGEELEAAEAIPLEEVAEGTGSFRRGGSVEGDG